MKNIYEIDRNFAFDSKLEIPAIRFYDVCQPPFALYGVSHSDGRFRRMPEAVARTVNDGVCAQSTDTAGGRVRFCTDSPYIAIHAKMQNACFLHHCALTGTACFDLYMLEDGQDRFCDSFKRDIDNRGDYETVLRPRGEGMRQYTIHFPTYSGVMELYIGLDENSTVQPAKPYAIEKPVVTYGSSITMGGCTSRPGTTYQSIVSRRFDCDHINLGFSGSARGEQTMARYIAELSMSVFVLDYDHNAPNPEHLAATHEPFYQTVRKAQPELPIVLMARPQYRPNADAKQRLQVIQRTYDNALAAGDTNVYLLTGEQLMALCGDDGMVDGAHPNDFGFGSMAKALGDVLEKIWNK